jgi:hypothetical protein
MDRVLLVIDDIQYAGHLEMTLRKVGFDIETITNEYKLQERLLTYNPDYVVVKGLSSRVSSMNVGKKLRESTKFLGKVILIFPEDQKTTPDEFIKLRMDLLLFEPITALRLVTHLLSLTDLDKEAITDKLLRFAHTDTQFRDYETQILKNSGGTIESEIKIISGESKKSEEIIELDELDEDDLLTFVQKGDAKAPTKALETKSSSSGFSEADLAKALKKSSPGPIGLGEKLEGIEFEITEGLKAKLKDELNALDHELPLRIESYNRAIKTFDQDLKKGHNKRKTRSTNKDLFKDIPQVENDQQDAERRKFAKALVKKKAK